MAPKQRNLLEAFRDAGGSGGAEGSSSAGPFAGPPAGAKKRSEAPSPPKAPPGERGALPPWVPLVLVGVLCFVLGLAVGRSTGDGGDETQAAGPADTSGESREETGADRAGIRPPNDRTSGTTTDPGGGSDPETTRRPPPKDDPVAALRDLRNEYTVIAVTYGGSQESNARATQKLLADLQLPVFPPVKVGSYLEILVGASPSRDGLDDVLRRVRAAEDWNGEPAFASAYVDRIDKHVSR